MRLSSSSSAIAAILVFFLLLPLSLAVPHGCLPCASLCVKYKEWCEQAECIIRTEGGDDITAVCGVPPRTLLAAMRTAARSEQTSAPLPRATQRPTPSLPLARGEPSLTQMKGIRTPMPFARRQWSMEESVPLPVPWTLGTDTVIPPPHPRRQLETWGSELSFLLTVSIPVVTLSPGVNTPTLTAPSEPLLTQIRETTTPVPAI